MTYDLLRAIREAKTAAATADDYKAETYLAVLLAELLSGRAAIAPVAGTQPGAQAPPLVVSTKPHSAAEFFAARRWKTDLDKIVLGGCFLERHAGAKNFNVSSVRSCLVNAKITLPKNLALAILKSVQRGWLMEVPEGKDGMKAYTLTQSGEHRAEELGGDKESLRGGT